jgi:hypothetical protein
MFRAYTDSIAPVIDEAAHPRILAAAHAHMIHIATSSSYACAHIASLDAATVAIMTF